MNKKEAKERIKYIHTSIFLVLILAFLCVPFSAVQGATLSKAPNNLGLVGYWPLNEGSSTKAGDLSGNGLTGTLSGNPVPAWISGKHNKGLSFSGTAGCGNPCTNYGLVTTSSFSLPTTLTVCVWIYPNRSEVKEIIIHGSAAPPTAFELYQNGLSVSLRGGSNTAVSSSNSLTLNSWNFVCGTISATTGIVYINGVGSTPATVAAPNSSSASLNIGAYNNNNYAFNGKIDDVRIYNRALSASDVLKLYQSGQVTRKMVSNNGLVGYWPLNEGTGTVAGDMSGNGKTGTLTGGTWAIGKRGGALSFNGTSDKVTGGNITVGTTMTISAWIKKNNSTGQKSFFSNRTGSGRVYLGLSGTQVFLYDSSATPSPIYSGSGSAQIGQWQHIVATNDGSTTVFYVNGVQVTSTSQVRTASTGAFGIGWDPSITTEYWDGLIDDVRVYSRVLSASEVLALYKQNETAINHSQNSRITSGLVGMWSFNGADYNSASTTAEILDRSVSGNNADNVGGTPVIGKVGQALNFSGTSQYSKASGFSAAGTSNQPYTFASWVKPAAGETDGNIIHMSSASTGLGWCLPPLTLVSGKARGNSWIGSAVAVTGTSTISPGSWYHLVTTWDSTGGLKIYVNGALENTTSQATYTASGSSNYIWLSYTTGSCSGDNGDYDGALDEVRIYSRSLSASEVKQLYDMGR